MALSARSAAPFTSSRPGQRVARLRTAVVAACQARASAGPTRRLLLGAGLSTALISVPKQAHAEESASRQGEVRHTEDEWEAILGPAAYRVMRLADTERRFSSPLYDEKRVGTFACAGCGTPLFASSTKYESGTGWPSFYAALPGAVDETLDTSIFFMPRTEVRCHRCKGHLGHVFDDGPQPTGLRYCMNGLALKFVPEGEKATAA